MKTFPFPRINIVAQASALWIILFLLIALIEVTEIFIHPLRLASEAAMQMECLQLMLTGRVPYVDFFPESTPLSFYLAGAPALLAKLLKLHPIFIFKLVILTIGWLSAILVSQLLKNSRTRITAGVILFFVLLPIIFRFQFGQTEYIFIVLFFPFLLTRWLRWHGQTVGKLSGVLAGISGGIAINLHPFFLLFPLLLELFWLSEKRTIRCFFASEAYALLAVSAIYWAHLFLYPPNMQHSFLHAALPFMILQLSCKDLSLMYQGSSPDQRNSIYAFIMIAILGLALRRRCSMILPLILFNFIAFMLFILRAQGASSDLVPLNAGTFILLPIVYFSLVKIVRLPSFPSANRYLLLGAIIASSSFLVYQFLSTHSEDLTSLKSLGYGGYQNKQDLAPLTDLIEQYSKPGDPVLVLTNCARAAYPLLLQSRRIPSSYYLSGYPIYLLQLADDQRLPEFLWTEAKEAVPNRLTIDLLKTQPVLVIMETGLSWEFLEKTMFGNTLKSHYKNVAGRNLRDLDSSSKTADITEYIGPRLNFDIYVKKDDKENHYLELRTDQFNIRGQLQLEKGLFRQLA